MVARAGAWLCLALVVGCASGGSGNGTTRPTYVGRPNAPDQAFGPAAESPSEPSAAAPPTKSGATNLAVSEEVGPSPFFLSSVDLRLSDQLRASLKGAEVAPPELVNRLEILFETDQLTSETQLRFPKVRSQGRGRWLVRRSEEVSPAAIGKPPLASTFVLDYSEPALVELLKTVPKSAQNPLGLEAFVSQVIETKTYSRGFDIASRVATLRSGDCTEHAVLLAALLRAIGVPARVMFGVVVALAPRGSFAAGHAWVEYVERGRWHRLDAALYGAAHAGPAGGREQIGIPGLDSSAAQEALWLYLTTDTLLDESAAFSKGLARRALRGIVSRVSVDLADP